MIADPNDANAHLARGIELTGLGRFDEAIEEFRKADKLWRECQSKDRKKALYNWHRVLFWQKRYDEGAAKCREALDIDPEYPDAYSGLGAELLQLGHFDDAIAQLRKADELWQKDQLKDRGKALTNWAIALFRQQHYAQAAEKYREALDVDPEIPEAHNGLGAALVELERFNDAIEPLRKADELWEKKQSEDRNIALRNWGSALLRQEQFEDATAKYALAIKIAPGYLEAVVDYSSSLAEMGRYRDAIAELDKASSLDPDDPRPHNNKADFLFQLGRYEDGWKEWWRAWQCYERKFKGDAWNAEQLEVAVYFANVLRDVFKFYDRSERFYLRVLERQSDNAAACTGLAILYQQWSQSDATTSEIQARLNWTVPRAIEMLKSQLDEGADFQTLLSLVDLYIETSDWTEARECLARADSSYGRYRLKRAKMTTRLGLVCLGSGEHDEAVKNFRQALLIKPGDLRLRSNLGTTLLKLEQFEAAQDEFARVLKLAPGSIEALLGAAQISIELADDGDPDQYQIAQRYLNDALKYGRNEDLGSKRLQKSEIAKIYYMRGYARIKSFEADASQTLSPALLYARSDFRKCKELDPNNRRAPTAIEKINKRRRRGFRDSWADVTGPPMILIFAASVFLVTQLDFFLQNWPIHKWLRLPWPGVVKDATVYSLLTFGSLLFMIAGLTLPKLLKLKVFGIELEKAAIDQVSAPSTLGISRSGSLTN